MPQAATKTETREVPMLDVRAAPVPSTLDREKRTVTFIASTGARGLRRRFWGEDYYEELEMTEQAIRMDRLNNGAPFLNSHDNWDVSDVLGVVERAWIESSQLMVEVRFSQREEVEPILQDIADGILRHVSVGYMIHEYQITEKQGELDVYRAVDWEPMEVSIVPIAFDDKAVARSHERKTSQATITTRAAAPSTQKEPNMATEERNTEAPAAPQAPEQSTITPEEVTRAAEEASRAAVSAERQRVSEIQSAVRAAKLDGEFANELIREGVSIDQARERIIDKWAEQEQPAQEVRGVRASVDSGVVDNMRSAVTNALLARGGVEKLADEGREFAGMSLLRISEDLLVRQGVNVRGMSSREIATRALSTSDLVNIAGSVTNRTLLAGYETSRRTFLGVFRQATANDFREINRVRLSGAPTLEEVKEDGEFKYGKVTDGKETYSLATYGKILPFTRQTIINDDMDALTRIPMMFGRAAADLESEIVWGIFTANAALSDGTALFHANHGNLGGTAGAPSETTLSELEQLMLAQTGLEGRLINVMPRFAIVGPKHKVAMQKLLTAVTPSASGDVNVYQNSMDLVVEARLTGDAWYLAADYNQVDTIEYCYLEGNQGVYIETREGFNIDGIEIKARHDFAAKAIDYRGLYKNAGK